MGRVITDTKKIKELLTRGVEDVIVRKSLEEKLASGKKLRIKFGIDPSAKELHLGNALVLRKLKIFQDLGHHIILIVGSFTGMIGDPSGKTQSRKKLTEKEIKENL